MKWCRCVGILVLTVGVMAITRTAPVQANPLSCSETCTYESDCDDPCWDPTLGQTTCGEGGGQYSTCNGPICTANYQPGSPTLVGAWAVDDPWTWTCRHYSANEYTMHDVNNCQFSHDYTVCVQGESGVPDQEYGTCCSYYICGGHTC